MLRHWGVWYLRSLDLEVSMDLNFCVAVNLPYSLPQLFQDCFLDSEHCLGRFTILLTCRGRGRNAFLLCHWRDYCPGLRVPPCLHPECQQHLQCGNWSWGSTCFWIGHYFCLDWTRPTSENSLSKNRIPRIWPDDIIKLTFFSPQKPLTIYI